MKNAIIPIASLFICAPASATLWNVQNLLSGNDGGFDFSSLHDALDSTPMTGVPLTSVASASRTYDDVSGAVNLSLALGNGDLMSLTGTLLFDGGGQLAANSTLHYTGLNTRLNADSSAVNSNGQIGYLPGDVCCGGSFDPNSFLDAGGGLNYLTLWGADFLYSPVSDLFDGSYDGSTFGMDLRLEMSAVPVPAAVYLFGTALIGLFGYQHLRAVT